MTIPRIFEVEIYVEDEDGEMLAELGVRVGSQWTEAAIDLECVQMVRSATVKTGAKSDDLAGMAVVEFTGGDEAILHLPYGHFLAYWREYIGVG